MIFILKGILIFILTAITDAIWTRYIQACAEKNAIPAAIWSGLIILCASITTISYISDKTIIPFVVAGAAVGTYLSIKKQKT